MIIQSSTSTVTLRNAWLEYCMKYGEQWYTETGFIACIGHYIADGFTIKLAIAKMLLTPPLKFREELIGCCDAIKLPDNG